MLITEKRERNGEIFSYNASDANLYIERDGTLYQEAWDPIEYWGVRLYTETSIRIPDPIDPDPE